jgi:hypothetical protein
VDRKKRKRTGRRKVREIEAGWDVLINNVDNTVSDQNVWNQHLRTVDKYISILKGNMDITSTERG